MPSVADALRAFAPAYLKRFGNDVPAGHRKVLSVITRCRPAFIRFVTNGWQHPRRKVDVEEIRWLACVALGLFFLLRFAPREQAEPLPALRCGHCGGELQLMMIILADGRVLWNHRQPFLDSG
jgi:hypothetical protein